MYILGSNTVTVNLEQDGNDFILCTLKDNSICNVALDLNFSDDDEIKFFLNGKGTVHLTGNYWNINLLSIKFCQFRNIFFFIIFSFENVSEIFCVSKLVWLNNILSKTYW